ncbi:MAG: DEAD/DEAH box helicase family protein [Myxococcota bacterium]
MSKRIDPHRLAARMSLRAPLEASLTLLARLADTMNLGRALDIDAARAVVSHECGATFEDFERAFPSLTFDIATGVGKTRLMGAFVAWLYLSGRSANFFVLAPNSTIYKKLVEDFTPGTRKYVFKGISEFVTSPPVLVTADDYQDGRGTRRQQRLVGGVDDECHINVFNIQRINQKVEGGRDLRIRRLKEYIGESYFDYLQGLPDLVLLMDESHRYRAEAGFATLNELRPMLGLELTATPFVQKGDTKAPFKNVVYSFPLREAMAAGYVKEPACTQRPNLDFDQLTPEQKDDMKLADGMRLHAEARTNLLLYARETGQHVVKPFVLVVARDTTHATQLKERMESVEFFDGYYKGKVIVITSTLKGEEKEENVERLVRVEDPAEATEVVIHVHMLKEGWDVTNLYTIIPLNAAYSHQLVEQSIGRGLRLPYGKRTGDPRADNLTIVAHDHYARIIEDSRKPGSIFIGTRVLPPDGAPTPTQPVEAPSTVEHILGLVGAVMGTGARQVPLDLLPPEAPRVLAVPASMTAEQGRSVAAKVIAVLQGGGRPGSALGSSTYTSEAGRAAVVAKVATLLREEGQALVAADTAAIEALADQVIEVARDFTIDVPRITTIPSDDASFVIDPFPLDVTGMDWLPIDQRLVVEQIRTGERYVVDPGEDLAPEQRIEDYIVRAVTDSDEIPYDDHADLLYDLAGQAILHFRRYLSSEDDVKNVVLGHQLQLGKLLRMQMLAHGREVATSYETRVALGSIGLGHVHAALPEGDTVRDYREPVEPRSAIRRAVFQGFRKNLAPYAKFDSEGERRLAVVLERDSSVLRWIKPGPGVFPVELKSGARYNPDFVAATADATYVVEIKAESEMTNPEVLAKADAAAVWCAAATKHGPDGRPWRFALVPDHAPGLNWTLEGLWRQHPYVARRPRTEG